MKTDAQIKPNYAPVYAAALYPDLRSYSMGHLKEIRENMGYTQPDFVERVKAITNGQVTISISTLWRAERGRPVSRINAKAIARALDLPLDAIDEFRAFKGGVTHP